MDRLVFGPDGRRANDDSFLPAPTGSLSDLQGEGGQDKAESDELKSDSDSLPSAKFTEGHRFFESQAVVSKHELERLKAEIEHAKNFCNNENNYDHKYD